MQNSHLTLARYDWRQSYDWNYDHAPAPVTVEAPRPAGEWTFCGRRVDSPLGVAAGPLLNGAWCLYYASLGFDVVTYKTVRSGSRGAYPLPNLQPVECGALAGGEADLRATEEFEGNWAVSFGMPSKTPETWMPDIALARRRLPANKLLSVSVVGTMRSGWSLDELADDYAICAREAASHGADAIEINLSCPNVNTCDGQLYHNPQDAALVAGRVRRSIGGKPLLAKIGHFTSAGQIPALLAELAPSVDAIATTNTVAATVVDSRGRPLFDGQPRGISGRGILDASVRQTAAVAEEINRQGLRLRVIGVGGAFTAQDVRRYLDAGAESVHLATAAMIDPEVGLKIRAEL
jgi:dihydroorotate dehydrogenase